MAGAREHAHVPTSEENWAEESPACPRPASYTAAAEDDFWKANHHSQEFAGDSSYEEYAPAYRIGYEGFAGEGIKGITFDAATPGLRRRYEHSGSPLPWDRAQAAALAAWERLFVRSREAARAHPLL